MVTLADMPLAALSSPDLLAALERTAAHGREATADLIALLAECDARQLYAAEGYASLFEFCVARLRLSESQAYHRIQAARAARDFPLVLSRLREGVVTLTAVALLRPVLTAENHERLLDQAAGRRKREVEALVRQVAPLPDVRSSVRKLAPPHVAGLPTTEAADRTSIAVAAVRVESKQREERRVAPPDNSLWADASTSSTPVAIAASVPDETTTVVRAATPFTRRAEITPLAPTRYSLRVTISQETHDKLRRAQDLLRHALPTADADPALVLDRALTLLLAQLERRKAGAPSKPRPATTAAETRASKVPKASGAPERKSLRADPRGTTTSGTDGGATGPSGVGSAPIGQTGGVHDCGNFALRGHRTDVSRGRTVPAGAGAPGVAAPRPVGRGVATRRSSRSRYIPAAVRRAVWDRDGARCAYVSSGGVRCSAATGLEFHHRVPFAEGGAATAENLMLACALHNAFEARRWFNSDQAEFGLRESGSPGV